MIRVLLLSPVRELDPANGDVTYTEQLLANPPQGVRYTSYDEALADGTLIERFRRQPGATPLAAMRREPQPWKLLREAAVNAARRRGLLFREPFRFFDVDPNAFDLVHSHVFSVRLGGDLPLVVSNSIQIDRLYTDGFGMNPAQVRRLERRDRWLAARCGVTHSAYGQHGAVRVVCFSEYLKQSLLAAGTKSNRLAVVPPGVDTEALPALATTGPMHLGFVGEWKAKGGQQVLDAFLRLRRKHPDIRLTVVGGEAQFGPEESEKFGITWLPRQDRGVLIGEVLPQFSVFVYPSRFDGLPLTLLEVMALGIPVIVSDYGALPEVVDKGRAGIVAPLGQPDALYEALCLVVDPAVRAQLGRAGMTRVRKCYNLRSTSAALGNVYRDSLAMR